MSGPSVVHKPDIWPLVYIYLSGLPVASQPIRTDNSCVLVQPSTKIGLGRLFLPLQSLDGHLD